MPDSALETPRRPGRPNQKEAGREKWIDAAWQMVGKGAFDPVRVEPIAKSLGITKGSFYWHFKDRQELVDELLDRWISHWELPDEIMALDDPSERLWHMAERVIRRDTHSAGVAFRYWSHDNPAIAKRLRIADKERFDLICSQLKELGFSDEEAGTRAGLYQSFMTGEFLRHGGEPIDERLKAAKAQHDLLVGRKNGGD